MLGDRRLRPIYFHCDIGRDRTALLAALYEVHFRGVPIANRPAYRVGQMGIARTFQVVKPFRNLSVQQNVAVGAMFGAGGARRSSKDAFATSCSSRQTKSPLSRRNDNDPSERAGDEAARAG